MNYNVRKVLEVAESWNKRNIKSIPGCPNETCAFFVRFVFKHALHQAGQMPVAYDRPYYRENNVRQLDTNTNMADGLAGDVVGARVNLQQIQPGDLLFFRDTYRGDFPVGSITHVGIYLGNGMMADSSGGKCHVRSYKAYFPGLLVEARRPRCLGGATNGIGVTLKHGEMIKAGNFQELKIQFGTPSAGTVANVATARFANVATGSGTGFGPGRLPMLPANLSRIPKTNHISTKPHVFVNGKEAPYKYITVDIALLHGGSRIKLFYHDGQTTAYVNGQKTNDLEIVAKFQGGLHVFVNGKEIKPASVNIGVS